MTGPAGAGFSVFAIDTTEVQVVWRRLPRGTLRVASDAVSSTVDVGDGAGSLRLSGLTPGLRHRLTITPPGATGPTGPVRLEATTLAEPPGQVRCRIATLSDLHLGETAFGYCRTITERGAAEPYVTRCTRAALREAVEWGADLVVVKGDAADQSHPEVWAQVVRLLGACPVPVVVVPGNHEAKRRRTIEPRRALVGSGVALVDHGVEVLDLPAVRVVLADTTRHGLDIGSLDRVAAPALEALAGAPAGALLLTHHHFARRPVHTELPYGIPPRRARRFLAAVGELHPATLVSSGHTHRHRRVRIGPVTVTTVGSVKDFPGVWAGYTVYDGGIVQSVRRIAEPSVLAWTERSARALGGLYRRWTPGRLTDRCFSLTWGSPGGSARCR